jgi:uncharacterized protein Yka (UPF0111/DUF47 family)
MEKDKAVAALGSASLLRPGQLRQALLANDRLKLYLTVLQAAAAHAAAPRHALPDLTRDIAAAGIQAPEDAHWLMELPATAARQGTGFALADLPRLAQRLSDDLGTMALPLMDDSSAGATLLPRVRHWQGWLRELSGPTLGDDALGLLTHGRRGGSDSLHLCVMDLHRALNQLAAQLAAESVGGAQVWQLAEGADGASDRARVTAFMRGVNRTRALKLAHPGLDTAATRDGEQLLIQNDIGTNDAHVLVLKLLGRVVTLTYSDLHRQRFAFFQGLLSQAGAQWSGVLTQTTAGLNNDDAYHVGTARFEAADEAALLATLEAIGARIVFLIDWNRARKRLLAFVNKPGAVAVLLEAAQRECGHMAWLAAGGERLAWGAMAAQGPGIFRLGDRLDEVLGDEEARAWLVDLMALAWQAERAHQPPALVAEEARWLLARRLSGRSSEVDLLQEHAAFCQALAQGVRDALAHGVQADADAAQRLAARAKTWERQADELVERARVLAERHPQWQALAALVQQADDVADALEEAAFVLSMVADGHHQGWNSAVRQTLQALADAVLTATQDLVKVLAMARTLDDAAQAGHQDEFLAALWRVVQAERQCDSLLRDARRALAQHVKDAASLGLGNELAAALEQASDALLALVHGVRVRMFRQAGVGQ